MAQNSDTNLPPKPEILDLLKRAKGLKQRIDYRKSGENPSDFLYRDLKVASDMIEETIQRLEFAVQSETDGITLIPNS